MIPQNTKNQSGKNKNFNMQQETCRTICSTVPNKCSFAFIGGQWGKLVETICSFRLVRQLWQLYGLLMMCFALIWLGDLTRNGKHPELCRFSECLFEYVQIRQTNLFPNSKILSP